MNHSLFYFNKRINYFHDINLFYFINHLNILFLYKLHTFVMSQRDIIKTLTMYLREGV